MANPSMAENRPAAEPQGGRRAGKKARYDLKKQRGFGTTALLCLAVLYAPIVILAVFSFNNQRSVTLFTGFSFEWYGAALSNTAMLEAAWVSFQIAIVATVASTIIATLAALATTRTKPWPGMGASYMVVNLPLMVPEIVTAIATLIFFALIATSTGIQFGIGRLMLAHTVFCIPFAYMPIRARLEDMDKTLEQAAADLYATSWQTFRRVTLPLLTPGIIGGAMLAFVVSFDDFTISQLVAGPGDTTLPIYIYGAIRRGISPEINAISTLILIASILLVTLAFLTTKKRG